MKKAKVLLLATISAIALSCNTWALDTTGLDSVTQELVSPPFLPKHEQTALGDPKIVRIRFVIEEKEIEIAPGVFIHSWGAIGCLARRWIHGRASTPTTGYRLRRVHRERWRQPSVILRTLIIARYTSSLA